MKNSICGIKFLTEREGGGKVMRTMKKGVGLVTCVKLDEILFCSKKINF